jgi:hypothetical protein
MWKTRFFREQREFLRLYLRENSNFYPNMEAFLSQLDKQFSKQKRLENCPKT